MLNFTNNQKKMQMKIAKRGYVQCFTYQMKKNFSFSIIFYGISIGNTQ